MGLWDVWIALLLSQGKGGEWDNEMSRLLRKYYMWPSNFNYSGG